MKRISNHGRRTAVGAIVLSLAIAVTAWASIPGSNGTITGGGTPVTVTFMRCCVRKRWNERPSERCSAFPRTCTDRPPATSPHGCSPEHIMTNIAPSSTNFACSSSADSFKPDDASFFRLPAFTGIPKCGTREGALVADQRR